MDLSDRAGGSVMNPTDEHVRRFLVRYGEALAAGDLKTISGCYAVPALVLSDAGSVPIAARQEIEAAFDGAAERYRALGLVDIRPILVTSEALSERLLSVDVRWEYLDEQGRSAAKRLPLRAPTRRRGVSPDSSRHSDSLE
jgi:hypothetical protein